MAFNVEKAFQLLQHRLDEMQTTLIKLEQTQTKHTGYFETQAVALKKLDDERLAMFSRLNRLEDELIQLKAQLAA